MCAKYYTSNIFLTIGVENENTHSMASIINEQEMMVFINLQIVYATAVILF